MILPILVQQRHIPVFGRQRDDDAQADGRKAGALLDNRLAMGKTDNCVFDSERKT
jgi:hypothetical protein